MRVLGQDTLGLQRLAHAATTRQGRVDVHAGPSAAHPDSDHTVAQPAGDQAADVQGIAGLTPDRSRGRRGTAGGTTGLLPRLPKIDGVRHLRSISGAPGTRSALLAVATVALFGLLSMHGWDTHAGLHADTGHAPAHVVAAHSVAHASAGAPAHDGETTGAADAVTMDAATCDTCGDDGSGDSMGLMGLCLAVLGGVLAAALALLLIGRRLPVLRTMLPTFRHPVLLSRDRDPPDLLRLCVIRC